VAEFVHQRGSVAELHALDPLGADIDIVPQVWWCDPTDSALVLGSRQRPELVDQALLSAAGLHLTKRRSGGGAVIVRPEAVAWIDVVLPHGIAPDDIRGAMVWIGERWLAALQSSLGAQRRPGELVVHRGGMLDTDWSELVCFAGIGPGEVLLDRRKLVGLSQRRTRSGLRIQGLVYREPVTAGISDLLLGRLPETELAEPALVRGLEPALLAQALTVALP
jgi:lipoate-protein ligase A